ncbi:hypothetical protein [Burkholderia cepacia]|uniref:hypothetical protein n=1 Tax=Burkholderia cepacia TaxID=292 RepID=UPI002AB64ACB|nr:hypothetical protein [Burkholderia cepacia]
MHRRPDARVVPGVDNAASGADSEQRHLIIPTSPGGVVFCSVEFARGSRVLEASTQGVTHRTFNTIACRGSRYVKSGCGLVEQIVLACLLHCIVAARHVEFRKGASQVSFDSLSVRFSASAMRLFNIA